jgi:hypothetical protein
MNARTMLVALTVVALTAVGCGQKREGEMTSSAPTPGPVALAGHSTVEQASHTETSTALESAGTAGSGEQGAVDAVAAESLPPEIDATVAETPVEPGTVIEISAIGSSDVTEMVLRDALGKSYPMTRNEETGAWRVFYRVPMKVHTDRLALSVTARNGVNQWRRVWVFPTVIQVEATSDSTGC